MKRAEQITDASQFHSPVDDANCSPDLAQVVDQLTTRLMSGEHVDWSVELAKHPQLADSLRELVPTLGWMAQLAQSAESGISTGSVPHRRLGDYQLIREIGRGGMGIVYEARQISLDRPVAVKILASPALLDDRQLCRFQNEARAAAMLKHPHIVTVHSVGQDQGINYFAMELVEGLSLSEVIDQIGKAFKNRDSQEEAESRGDSTPSPTTAPTTWPNKTDQNGHAVETCGFSSWSTEYSIDRRAYFRSVAGLGIQAARALEFAHQQGVLHRDVKPSNLLVDFYGKLYITDFGLARIQVDASLTQTGDFIGTLRYTSPEQLEGREQIDHRSDVYALGLTLYELLTLCPAFAAEHRQQLARDIIEQDPPRPRQHEPILPIDLETIVLKATAKHPDDRYQHASEVADDLQRFLDDHPVQAQRTGAWGKVTRWAKRNPLVAALLTLVLITLSGAAFAGLAGSLHLSQIATEMQRQLYASDIRRAQGLLANGEIRQAIEVLQKYERGSTAQSDDRQFEWFYLRSVAEQLSPTRSFDHPIGAYDAVFSPDGRRLATCTWNSKIFLWDIDTGKLLQTLSGHNPQRHASRLQFTSDGTGLISGGNDGTIRFWDLASGEEITRIEVHEKSLSFVRDFALCEEDQWVAAICQTREFGQNQSRLSTRVIVWDLNSRQPVATLPESDAVSGGLSFSPDSHHLVAGTELGRLLVWSTVDWRLNKVVDAHASPVRGLAWSPDGTKLISAGSVAHHGFVRGELKWWNPRTWRLTRDIQHHDDHLQSVDFSADGRWLLVAANDGRVSIWQSDDGTCVRSFRPHAARVFAARLSPDGEYLATASEDNLAKVWKAADLTHSDEAFAVYNDIEEFIPSLQLVDQGRSVMTADITGQITKRSVSDGKIDYQFRVRPPSGWRIGVAVSPDNQWFAVATGFKVEGAEQGEMSIHRLGTGELESRFVTPEAYLHGFEFSPDGRWLAVGSSQAVFIFDWQRGEIEREIGPLDYVKQFGWSPGGDGFCIVESSGYTSVFQLPDFRLRKRFVSDEGRGTIALAYSPNGKDLATAGGSRKVKIWDADTLKLSCSFEECPDWIASVHFSRDGRRVVTTGKDGKLRVWHRDSGVCLLTLNIFTDDMRRDLWPMNAQMSNDGRLIVAATDKLHVWRCKRQFARLPIYLPPDRVCQSAMELLREREAD